MPNTETYEMFQERQPMDFAAQDAEEYHAYLDRLSYSRDAKWDICWEPGIHAVCSACIATHEFGTAKELERRGWQIGQFSAFCFLHAGGF